jgi:hypothetical protein
MLAAYGFDRTAETAHTLISTFSYSSCHTNSEWCKAAPFISFPPDTGFAVKF